MMSHSKSVRTGHLVHVAILLIIPVLLHGQQTPVPEKPATGNRLLLHNVGPQMVKYTKEGRYDEAIQTGLQSLTNESSDEIIYEGIATVYLVRAEKESDKRELWVDNAISYTKKALALNSKEQDAAGVHLFQDARAFEVAGDLSTTKKCTYYSCARKILMDRIPLLQGEQLIVEGKPYPLAPLRNENGKRLAEVNAKVAHAGCT